MISVYQFFFFNKVLRDADLRRIYHACGWRGLVQSETYAEASVFDTDFFVQFEDFFGGKDEDDRQYLLLNAPNALSDDDDEEEEEEEEQAAAAAAADGAEGGWEQGGGEGGEGI